MQDSTFAHTDYPDFSIFIFKVNLDFMEEKYNPVGNAFRDEEEWY